MKVLLAVDGSVYTRRMLDYVAAHDDFLPAGTRFTVLTVVAAMPPRALAYMSKHELHRYYEEQAREVLDPVKVLVAKEGWTAAFGHAVGGAAAVIADTAQREGCDLVILGSHGHGALAGLVLGSVTTAVLARSSVPVLVVRGPRPDA